MGTLLAGALARFGGVLVRIGQRSKPAVKFILEALGVAEVADRVAEGGGTSKQQAMAREATHTWGLTGLLVVVVLGLAIYALAFPPKGGRTRR